MLDIKIYDSKIRKLIISPTFHHVFNKQNGQAATWGRTEDEDPDFCPAGPLICDIEVSTICHKGCVFCYKSNTSVGKNMSFETFKIIFDKLPKTVTQIAFGIGTLSANRDLWKIMQYCRDNFVVPNITVNGQDISKKGFDNLAKYMGAVSISHYNDNDCFNSVKELTDRGMKQINIHALVSSETYTKCIQLMVKAKMDKRLKKLNAIVFLLLKPKGDRNHLHQIESLKKYKSLINFGLEHDIKIGFDSCSAPSFLEAVREHRNYESFKQCADPCESTCFSGYINVEGKFFPCSFTEDQPEYKGIDILKVKDFVKEVWYGEETIKFRNRLLANKDCNGCRNCPEFDLKMRGV
jgi:hypothetical protein